MPDAPVSATPTVATCLPLMVRDRDWRLEVRQGYGEEPEDETRRARQDVFYANYELVPLPDGTWLAIASRMRVIQTEASAGDAPQATIARSVGDIVAWWSPQWDFPGKGVRGPFLLVDSLFARPDEDARLWSSVPDGVVVPDEGGGSLYVYYVNEAPEAPYVDARDGYSLDGFEPGTAVKRIALDDLMEAVRAARPGLFSVFRRDPTDEGAWTSESALPGELLGPVRVWAAQDPVGHPLPHPVTGLGRLYPSVSTVVDPAPVRCGDGLHLFFAQIPRGGQGATGPSRGQSVWHATAIPEGMVLRDTRTADLFVSRFGVDFVVAPPSGDGLSPDQVTPRGADRVSHGDRLFLDPDPVRLPDGTWRVYAGTQDGAGLWRFEGSDREVCTDWASAWRR